MNVQEALSGVLVALKQDEPSAKGTFRALYLKGAVQLIEQAQQEIRIGKCGALELPLEPQAAEVGPPPPDCSRCKEPIATLESVIWQLCIWHVPCYEEQRTEDAEKRRVNAFGSSPGASPSPEKADQKGGQ